MPEFPLDPDLAAVTTALRGLAPAAPDLNRDRLLYEAGRRAGSVADRRRWQFVAGLFAVSSIGLGVRLVTIAPRTEVVYVAATTREGEAPAEPRAQTARQEPRPPGSPAYAPAAEYLRLRDLVVRFGADSLPTTLGALAQPRSADLPVEHLLGLPPGTLNDAQKSRWQHQLSRGDV